MSFTILFLLNSLVLQRRQFDASIQTEDTNSGAQINDPDAMIQTDDLDTTYVEEDVDTFTCGAKETKAG